MLSAILLQPQIKTGIVIWLRIEWVLVIGPMKEAKSPGHILRMCGIPETKLLFVPDKCSATSSPLTMKKRGLSIFQNVRKKTFLSSSVAAPK